MRKSQATHAFFDLSCSPRFFLSLSLIAVFTLTPLLEAKIAYAQYVPVNDQQTQQQIRQGFQQEINTMRQVQQQTTLIARITQSLETKENILDGIAFAALNVIISYIGDSLVQ